MSTLFFVNWLAALIGITHVLCTLSHLNHLNIGNLKSMAWRRRFWELAWRFGYAALGAGCAGILAGPIYGYTHPQGWEVMVNVGWPTALIANYARTRDAT